MDVPWALLNVVIGDILETNICGFKCHDFLKNLAEYDLQCDKIKVERPSIVVISTIAVLGHHAAEELVPFGLTEKF